MLLYNDKHIFNIFFSTFGHIHMDRFVVKVIFFIIFVKFTKLMFVVVNFPVMFTVFGHIHLVIWFGQVNNPLFLFQDCINDCAKNSKLFFHFKIQGLFNSDLGELCNHTFCIKNYLIFAELLDIKPIFVLLRCL